MNFFHENEPQETRERSPCVTEGVDKDAINSGLKYVNNIP